MILKFKDADFSAIDLTQLGVGGLAALVTGYLALTLLVKLVKSGMFKNFAWYCWGAAIVAGVLAFAT